MILSSKAVLGNQSIKILRKSSKNLFLKSSLSLFFLQDSLNRLEESLLSSKTLWQELAKTAKIFIKI